MTFHRIDAGSCKQLINDKDVTVLDIRDPQSYANGHIEAAIHIEQIDVESFVDEQPKDKTLVICCYHGNSSQSAAAFFAEKGFTDVYSLDGGFEAWRMIDS